ncbi:hypothetical protein OIU77_022436 [Salix suchowensis]|uniref:Uncharacterized protein n=1 Tax=Salix suchowensis TaxID=1278906 RepID=A0ABQ9C2A7_9ROSI|nr:hypothetical protein OIU77_022436 [Salix suchowensis]
MSESTWNKKVEVLKSLGWTEEESLQAFKRCPFCFTCSEEKIRSVVDFLVNTLKMEPRTVIGRPEFLMLSVDKRIRPRTMSLSMQTRSQVYWRHMMFFQSNIDRYLMAKDSGKSSCYRLVFSQSTLNRQMILKGSAVCHGISATVSYLEQRHIQVSSQALVDQECVFFTINSAHFQFGFCRLSDSVSLGGQSASSLSREHTLNVPFEWRY